PDRRLHHPRPLGSEHAGRSDRRHDATARPDQDDLRREADPAARRHPLARDRRVLARLRRDLARARRGVRAGAGPVRPRGSVLFWQLLLLVVLLASWEWLTGIKAISKTPGLYWIDPFFISRPSLIARRFAYLLSDRVRLRLWQMTLSNVQSMLWVLFVCVWCGCVSVFVLGWNYLLAVLLERIIMS